MIETPQFEPLLTDVQVAQMLRLHQKTVQKLARNGEIPAIRIGRYWRFSPSALQRWINVQSLRQSSTKGIK